MSSGLMLLIAALYFGAMTFYGIEGKWGWALVCLSWGLGNATLAFISR